MDSRQSGDEDGYDKYISTNNFFNPVRIFFRKQFFNPRYFRTILQFTEAEKNEAEFPIQTISGTF